MEKIEILVTSVFEKALKRLAKKYRTIKNVYQNALIDIEKSPGVGDEIKGHQDFFKVRYPNPDAKKGKSGGFRLIYYWSKSKPNLIILTDIYSKSDQQEVNWDLVNNAMEEIENERL